MANRGKRKPHYYVLPAHRMCADRDARAFNTWDDWLRFEANMRTMRTPVKLLETHMRAGQYFVVFAWI